MSARHDDYKVDWRNTRPGDLEPVAARKSRREGWLIFCGCVISIGVLLWQAGVFKP